MTRVAPALAAVTLLALLAGCGDADGDALGAVSGNAATAPAEGDPAPTEAPDPTGDPSPDPAPPPTTGAPTDPPTTGPGEVPAWDSDPSPIPTPVTGSQTEPVRFGETFLTAEGVAITSAPPVEYQPADTSAGYDGVGTPLAFDITIANTSDSPVELTDFRADLEVGGERASQIFDIANEVGGQPRKTLPPNTQLTFRLAFEVTGTDLTLKFGNFGTDIVSFTS